MKKRQSGRSPRFRRLGMEWLESRVVLDGNIRAFLRGGSLHIQEDPRNGGSQHSNEILIEQSASRSFTLTSRDGDTTINGQAGPVTFNNVRRDMLISLGSGNDVVELDGEDGGALVVKGRLFIDTGSGADQVLLTNVHALRLHIETGSRNDTISIGDDGAEPGVRITKEAIINTGSGQDNARIANSQFHRMLAMNMGGNNDTTSIQDTFFNWASPINGSGGRDTLNRQGNTGKPRFISFEVNSNSVQSPAPIPPIAANDTATVIRSSATPINVATNDTAASGKTLNLASIVITQAPTNGTATANANGTVTYTNNGNAATTDSFQYTIKDSAGITSNVATVAITVNAALAAVADAADVTEDATPNTTTGNVLTNDTGGTGAKTVSAVNGNAASVGVDVAGTRGTFRINADGTFTYTLDNTNANVNALNNGEILSDAMAYTAKAGNETSNATLTVTIHGHTDLVAIDDPASVTEDATVNTATGNVLSNDTGGSGTKTVTAVNGTAASVGADVAGAHGTFHINADGSFTYTLNNADTAVNNLNSGQTLPDTMNYTVGDGTTSDIGAVNITIQGTTELLAVDDPASITEDATPNNVTGNVLTNDTGGTGTKTVTAVNGNPASVGVDVAGAHGTFHINANGTFTYTLNNADPAVDNLGTGQTLPDTMNYTVGAGTATDIGAINITIQGSGELLAVDDPASVTEDASPPTATGNVLSNDTGGAGTKTVTAVNGNAASVGADVPGTHGTFHINADGTFTYTLNNADTAVNNLNNGETLPDTMNYTVGAGGATDIGTLTVTIQGHTELVADDDPTSVTEDDVSSTASGNVITNDSGGNGTKTVSAVNGSAAGVNADVPGAHGTFHINADGTFTYTLNNNDAAVQALNDGQTLPDSIDYTLTDGIATDIGTLTVTIQGTTDLNLVNDNNMVDEDSPTDTVNGNVLNNDSGGVGTKSVTAVEGEANKVDVDVPGTYGTFHIKAEGTYTYTLDNNNSTVNNLNDGATLEDGIDFTVTAGGVSGTESLSITIHGATDS